ncbi:MAG: hypothetical protein U0667_08520 [Chloroflexota bacterium]
MSFSEFRLDVVPAFQYNTGYYKILTPISVDGLIRMPLSSPPG